MPLKGVARRERAVRRVARALGTAFVAIVLVFFVGETFAAEPEGAGGPLAWYEWMGLGLLVVGLVGFVLAWWRPFEGGILGLLGLVTPTVQSLLYLTSPEQAFFLLLSPFNLAILAGVLHLVDARWRRRGIGPPIGRIREDARQPASQPPST